MIIGFVVQYTTCKNKIDANTKTIEETRSELDSQEKRIQKIENNESPSLRDLKNKIEKLEEFNRNSEQNIIKLETKIDVIESKLTELCLDVKEILRKASFIDPKEKGN
jgi:chromosome segregation ATPase